MKHISISQYYRKTASLAALLTVIVAAPVSANDIGVDRVKFGRDNNSALNPFVQPTEAPLAGGGRDQSLQFADNLIGSYKDDLLVGGLGVDVLSGGYGDDVLVGGLEHFNPANRDRAFGGAGSDIFIWKPGDGSDFFEGGKGVDVVVFGVAGEISGGRVKFEVLNDQKAGRLAIAKRTHLPYVDVSNSPGFCNVIDKSTTIDAAKQLRALRLDNLVQFSIRGIADSFASGEQDKDNGLRVTLHLKSVEILVCTNREGGEIEIVDLTKSPARKITWDNLAHPRYRKLVKRLRKIVR